MPIRFRCAYCNQLMGISHRKMGSIVRCPKCSGQVVVPQVEDTPDDDASARDGELGAAVKALEDPELELLLAGAASDVSSQPKRKRKAPPNAILEIDVEPLDPVPPPLPALAALEAPAPSLSEPVPIAPASAMPVSPSVVTLPRWVVGGVAGVVLLLMALVFVVGYLLGKSAGR